MAAQNVVGVGVVVIAGGAGVRISPSQPNLLPYVWCFAIFNG